MLFLRLFFHHQRHLGLGYEVKQIIRDRAPFWNVQGSCIGQIAIWDRVLVTLGVYGITLTVTNRAKWVKMVSPKLGYNPDPVCQLDS